MVRCYGDDTLGQCGQGDKGRVASGPYPENYLKEFTPIDGLKDKKITDIACGGNHSLFIEGIGNIYGCGNNSFLQLSHQEEFSRYQNPLMVLFSPKQLVKNFDNSRVKKVAAGRDFTIVAVETGGDAPETEIYAAGVNKWGQLGIGELSDCSDFTKIRPLSNLSFQETADGATSPMKVIDLQCGSDHCICLTNMGVMFEWGANDKGQLGNKRRGFTENPLIVESITNKK